MRIGWIGFHEEGLPALTALLDRRAPVVGVITLTGEAAAKRSGAADYAALCRSREVPVVEVDDVNGEKAHAALRDMDPDVCFVIGWTQLVRAETLALARLGMIGAHASVLPHNRGRAPVNWALIRGERETGNTLFWLDPGTDSGRVVDVTRFPISEYDTCATLYAQVARSNRDMILRTVERLARGECWGAAQPESDEELLPRRRPGDGLIDFARPQRAVYDFIRALTRPYPGAFTYLDGHRWTVWQAASLDVDGGEGPAPGEIVGRVVSPVAAACGQVVACGRGSLLLLEVEDERGRVFTGPELAGLVWAGRMGGDG